MMRVSEHVASLSTPKARRSTSASASSSATLPEPVDTPPTISGGSGEIQEDVELDCVHNEPLMRGPNTSPRSCMRMQNTKDGGLRERRQCVVCVLDNAQLCPSGSHSLLQLMSVLLLCCSL